MSARWALPGGAIASVGQRPFRVYVHVPWCASRCGYCDFNTYVPTADAPASPASYVQAVRQEIRKWRSAFDQVPVVSSVFFGGGTPTLLPADDLSGILHEVRDSFGIAADAEVTTEANPESVDAAYLAALRESGFNRVSLGMQSAVTSVLATLDRQHTPGRAVAAVSDARAGGFDNISLDLMYGTPGESDDDWRRTLDTAIAAGPSHISAYSLIVEPATRLARNVAAGRIPAPDDDVLAQRYLIADDLLSDAGFDWYEISNWAQATSDGRFQSAHNLGYWHSDDWLAVGPGAHSHIHGVRWSNVKLPARYQELIAADEEPVDGYEVLSESDRGLERIMLELRLASGIAVSDLSVTQVDRASRWVTEGTASSLDWATGRLVLTRRGRLLADALVRELAE